MKKQQKIAAPRRKTTSTSVHLQLNQLKAERSQLYDQVTELRSKARLYTQVAAQNEEYAKRIKELESMLRYRAANKGEQRHPHHEQMIAADRKFRIAHCAAVIIGNMKNVNPDDFDNHAIVDFVVEIAKLIEEQI